MASDLKADQRTAAVILAPLVAAMFIAPVVVALRQSSNTPQPVVEQAK
jgi:hypothetical protein